VAEETLLRWRSRMAIDTAMVMDDARATSAVSLDPLIELIRKAGILRATPDNPIVSRDGSQTDWMLYMYPVTLSATGGRLAADAMLAALQTFASRQLVSIGYTGIPLMTATVLASDGEFIGACIRDSRKAYGSRRRIEGDIDRSRPVVVIDDSISSGKSFRAAVTALEDEGFEVEGGVALVRFPWRGGIESARAHGYRIETIVDIWQDVGMPLATHVHGHDCVPTDWSDDTVPSGLHPAVVARLIAEELLRSGKTLRPPTNFDATYEGPGGVFVSFRDRVTEHRVARSGFWHFDPYAADAARDVVLATARTVDGKRRQLRQYGLDRLKIAVSFLGTLRKVEPSGLDFDELGVVVRSTVQPAKVGGALPHTQVFTSDLEQYRHAAFRNARLNRFEPHEIFVHTVAKEPEPGVYWLPYGASGLAADHLPLKIGEQLTARAAAFLRAQVDGHSPVGDPLDDKLVPDPVHGIGVTLYHRGVIGCTISSQGSLDDCLRRATVGAANDPRFAARMAAAPADEITISVSVLRDREALGRLPADRALTKARPGVDAVGISDGQRSAVFLPQVAVHYDWSKQTLATQLAKKAGIDETRPAWVVFRTDSWVASPEVRALRMAFPNRAPVVPDEAQMTQTLELLCRYIVGQLQPTGIPAYAYAPIFDRTTVPGTGGRVLHALTALIEAGTTLGRADFIAAARPGVDYALEHTGGREAVHAVTMPEYTSSTGADAELLLALAGLAGEWRRHPRSAEVFERLRATVRPDGRVDPSVERRLRSEHDFLPGLVLLALGSFANGRVDLPDLSPQLEWYSRRFGLLKPWGMVGWHPQAWQSVWQVGWRSERIPPFVGDMLDWAIRNQHRASGAFLTDLNLTGPSFHTPFVMEGVADGARLLHATGHVEEAEEAMAAWRRGFALLDRLLIREGDTFAMPDPDKAVGGVRGTLTSTTVRIDFVSHTALAIVKALKYAQEREIGGERRG
jgi:orotate phosphoribosyltransferase/AMMECR1 domain-containing protein